MNGAQSYGMPARRMAPNAVRSGDAKKAAVREAARGAPSVSVDEKLRKIVMEPPRRMKERPRSALKGW